MSSKRPLRNRLKEIRITPRGLALLFVCIELLIVPLNDDKYLQVSGLYAPIAISVLLFVAHYVNHEFVMEKAIPFIFAIACAAGVSVLLHPDSTDRGYLLSYAVMMSFAAGVLAATYSRRQLNKLALCYVLSGVLLSLMVVLAGIRYYADTESRITVSAVFGQLYDPNYLAAYIVGPLVIAFGCFLESDSSRERFAMGCMSLLMAFAIFRTGSRGALVGTLFAAAFLVLSGRNLARKTRNILIALFVAALLGLLASMYLSSDSLSRLMVGNWRDPSNDRRLRLWGNAASAIAASPLFGQGISGSSTIIGLQTGDFEPAHNTFLEIWLQLGALGVVPMVGLLVYGLAKSSRVGKGLIVATAICSLFVSMEACICFWMNIVLACALGKNSKGGEDGTSASVNHRSRL